MTTDAAVLALVDAAFGEVLKPEHFTNFEHCEECAEHDQTLREHDRATLGLEQLGNPGWDPLCFCSSEGMAYYFPTLARLSLAKTADPWNWYGEQLLFHLLSGGSRNDFFQYCATTQRAAIAALISYWIETRPSEYLLESTVDELLQAHTLWSAPKAA
jgi:hypothetical protein